MVWVKPKGDERSRRYGLQWRDRSAARLARLKTVIAASAWRG